jgi:PhzF family phenazine biosynthesis protein
MQIPYYEVDAFTNRVFAGNPAGVCIVDRWLPDELMQSIAAENNFSETAFVLREGDHYRLTWFTPTMEVDLCGHATLATAFVLLREVEPDRDRIVFHTKTDELIVEKRDDLLAMAFPSRMPDPCPPPPPEALIHGLGAEPKEVHRSRDLMAVFDSEDDVRRLAPNFAKLCELDCLCTIATAPGEEADFVSRVFVPAAGIDEDPVTGSTHCTLIPFWAKRLNKSSLHAFQISPRGGEIFCEDRGDRCTIAGSAVIYLEGTITVPDPK